MQIKNSMQIRHAISTVRTSGHYKKCKPNSGFKQGMDAFVEAKMQSAFELSLSQ